MTTEIPMLDRSRTLDEAFALLRNKSAPAVAIVDAAGRLIGLITSETVGEMLMVREALPRDVDFRALQHRKS